MGWLWACLGGGGPTSKEQRHCSKTFIHHQSKGRLSSPTDHLRFRKAREGYGSLDTFPKAGAPQTSSGCSDPRKLDVSRRSRSSSTTMKIHFEGNFDAETNLQSDVEEMKEELATLRQILVAEADQARELREEVNYLRSCGVLHKNYETVKSLVDNEDPACPEGWDMMICQNQGPHLDPKKHLSERDSSVKKLRKCQSGPMNWSANSSFSNFTKCSPVMSLAAAERTVKCMQSEHKRLSAQRAALFPKLQFCQQDVQEEDCQGDAGMSSDGNEEGDTDLHDSSSPTTLATNGSQISLTEGVHEDFKDFEAFKGGESGAEALEAMQWMGVQRSPISSSLSSIAKDKAKFTSKFSAHLVGADGVTLYSQRTGKREQNKSGNQAQSFCGEQSLTVRSLGHCEVADQVFECSEIKEDGEQNLEKGHCASIGSIDLEPIQCASPTLSQKRAASMATSLPALPISLSLSPDLQEFDKMEIGDSAEWDGICGSDDNGSIDMQLIECNSPFFSPKRKSSITGASSIAAESKFHSVVDSPDVAGRNHKVSIETSTEDSFFGNSSTWNSSPETTDQSWYSDAIEALQNMNDVHMSMELCPLSFEENSPAVNQHEQLDVRPMDGCPPEKKVVKRAFSWYVSETDVQRNHHRYEGVQDDSELCQMGDERTQHSSLATNGVQHRRSPLKSCSNFERGFWRGDEKNTDTKESCAELRKDRIPGFMQGVDKENIMSADQQTWLSQGLRLQKTYPTKQIKG